MLEVSSLRAGYGKAVIVESISLSVREQSIVALLGGNGTGKSTVLRALAGLIQPMDGQITFLGVAVQGLSTSELVKRGLCLVPQGKEVFAQMTVKENLLMGAYVQRSERAKIASSLEKVIGRFPQLGTLYRRRAGFLSGGERQLLVLGRALMSDPKCLLLDEPSAALSPKAIGAVRTIIESLRAEGMGILLVEQNVGLALQLAERIIVLRDGKVALDREIDAQYSGEELKSYYLGGRSEQPTP